MEDECFLSLAPSNVAFVAKGNRPKVKRYYYGKLTKKGPNPFQNSQPKDHFFQEAKG